MTRTTLHSQPFVEAATYQICVEGCLEQKWSDWFDGFDLKIDGRQTVLTGTVTDQAALFGLLGRIRDLDLTLVSVQRIDKDCC